MIGLICPNCILNVSCLLIQAKWLSILCHVILAGFFLQKYSSSCSVSASEHDAEKWSSISADWHCSSGVKGKSCGLQVLKNCRFLDSGMGRIRGTSYHGHGRLLKRAVVRTGKDLKCVAKIHQVSGLLAQMIYIIGTLG